ncbi:hypothetical protein F4775DRAFT_595877 [Biscogniauxia sp. FL1348]|nr:hypothetical protein F4775DRAFT_595877 [Biscogniauxia sp. FL1348]
MQQWQVGPVPEYLYANSTQHANDMQWLVHTDVYLPGLDALLYKPTVLYVLDVHLRSETMAPSCHSGTNYVSASVLHS